MVAPAARRRFLSFWLASLMLTGALAALVPTASAGEGTVSVSKIVVQTPAGEATATSKPTVVLNQSLSFTVYGNVTYNEGDCSDTLLQPTIDDPTITTTIGLSRIGHDAATPMVVTIYETVENPGPQITRRYAFYGHVTRTVTDPAAGQVVDGQDVTFPISLSSDCDEPAPSSGAATETGVTAAIFLDTKRPHVDVGVVFAEAGKGGIGKTITFTTDNPDGIFSGTIALSQLNASRSLAPLSAGPTSVSVVVGDTGFENPVAWLNLTDSRGNKREMPITRPEFDAARPVAPTLSLGATSDGGLHLIPVSSSGDVVAHRVNLTGPEGSRELLCPGTDCAAVSLPQSAYKISASFLQSNRTYAASAAAFDDQGNEGPWSAPSNEEKTVQTPKGTLRMTLAGGKGGIGSVVRMEWVAGTVRDVEKVSLTAPSITQPVSFSQNVTPFEFIVTEENGDGATPAITLTSQSGTQAVGSVVNKDGGTDFSFFDTTRPAKVASTPVPRALANGAISVRFGASPSNDVTHYNVSATCVGTGCQSTATRHLNMTGTTDSGTGEVTFTIPGSFFAGDLERTWRLRVAPVDEVDNLGTYSDPFQAIPSKNPVVLEPDNVLLEKTTNPNSFLPVTGDWAAPNGLTSLVVALQSANGTWWTGSAASNGWTAQRTAANEFPVNVTPSGATTSGRFSADFWCNPSDAQNCPADRRALLRSIPDGSYKIHLTLTASDGASQPAVKEFILDKTAPVATTTPAYVGNPGAGFQQGTGGVKINAPFTDGSGVGLKDVTFQLVYLTNSSPVIDVFGQAAPAVKRVAADGLLPAEIPLPIVALGEYRFTVSANDTLGNMVGPTLVPGSVKLQPRLSLNPDPARPPFADANGLQFEAYAAFDSDRNMQPFGRCDADNACRVTKVEIYGRNRTTPEADAKLLDVISIPLPGTLKLASPGPKYYNYSRVGPLDLKGLNRDDMFVQARAFVDQPGGAISNRTPWTRVSSDAAPSGLSIARPENATIVYPDGSPGGVKLNVTYEKPGLESAPVLRYDVRVLRDAQTPTRAGQYVNLSLASGNPYRSSPWGTPLARTHVVEPSHFANFTNAQALPSGEYELIVSLLNDALQPVLTVTRPFAVETSPVSISIPTGAEQPQVHNVSYVAREFDLRVKVVHGFANLTTAGLVLTMDAPQADGSIKRLTNGSDGFSYSTSFQPDPAATESTVVFRVKLPTGAQNGGRFDLYANVTTTTSYMGGGAKANATAIKTLILDDVIPNAAVSRTATNETGRLASSELRVSGVAQDLGSGVATVKVRLIDLSTNPVRTFVWNAGENGSWQDGVVASWLTSDLIQTYTGNHVRNVVLHTACPATRVCWAVNDQSRPILNGSDMAVGGSFNPIGLDRNHTYRVDVRAYDHLGLESAEATATVAFDPEAPTILSPLGPGSPTERAATGYLNSTGHQNDNLTIGVTDNWCLKSVRLVGERPDGSNVTSVPFERPEGATCNGLNATAGTTWRLNLSTVPHVTRLPGRYNFSVEAEDTFGRVTRSGVLSLVVNDTERPVVRNIHAEPPVVRQGGASRIAALIEENSAVERVVVSWLRLHPDGTHTFIAEGLARLDTSRPADPGTAWYVADTSLDLNLSGLALGDYVWHVRPEDASRAVTCKPPHTPPAPNPDDLNCYVGASIVRVTADAAPSVRLQVPESETAWINRTPELRFETFNYGGAASGIVVSAGPDAGNLTRAAASEVSVTLVRSGGNVTGAKVTYRPTLNATTTSWVVEVSATPDSGLGNASTFGPFRVDAVAPNVTIDVTGLVDLDGVSWGVPTTRVSINATDALGNVTSRTYRVNGDTPAAYAAPVAPTGTGAWRFTATAIDSAGNAGTNETTLQVDTEGPSVSAARPGDDLLLTVEDAGAGVDDENVTVFFAYGDATTFTPLKATRGTGNTFTAALGGDAKATGLKYYVVARDRLGNVGGLGSAADPEVVEKDDAEIPPPPPVNRPPVLRIVSPAPNATLPPGEVRVQWETTDPDGDEVTVTVALRRGGNATADPLRNDAPATGSDAVTISALGQHAFVLVASDGADTTLQEVAFTIRLEKVVTPVAPLPSAPKLGEQVPILVKVADSGRAIRSVGYVVERDGTRVESGLLTGTGDSFAGSFKPSEAGDYEVFVVVTYAEGPADSPQSLGTFSVIGQASAPTAGFPVAFAALVALAVATIALSAGGAFWRWRK